MEPKNIIDVLNVEGEIEQILNQINQLNLSAFYEISNKNSENSIMENVMELSELIDKKCICINEQNQKHSEDIEKYNLMMEKLILEYHKICKKLII